jgi:superfamily I DNA/RNA helicase
VLIPQRRGGEAVQLVVAADGDQETRWVGKKIYSLIHEQGARPEDIAVLYRSSRQCDPVEALLQEHGIAYRVLGGQAFYDKKQVKDVLAYFKVIVAPQDDLGPPGPRRALARRRPQEPRAPDDFARRHGLSLMEAIHRSAGDPRAAGRARPPRPVLALIKRAQAHYYASGSASGALRSVIDNVGLKAATSRKENGGRRGRRRPLGERRVDVREPRSLRAARAAKGGRPRWNDFFQAMNQDNKRTSPRTRSVAAR